MAQLAHEMGFPGGLSTAEVHVSRLKSGSNQLSSAPRVGFFRKFLSGFGDPIIKILLAALAINTLFLFRGEGWFESAGIAIAIFLATFVSAISEYGSESAFIRLKNEAARQTCRVRRNGQTVILPVSELVVGDIVLLGAGEAVPADGIVMSGSLGVDQSALNGESAEVFKVAGTLPPSVRRWDLSRPSQLFRGSLITSGDGFMLIYRVGDSTFFGGMAASLQEQSPESPLKLRLTALATTISRFGYVAAATVAFADLFNSIIIDNGFIPSLIYAELSSLPAMAENLLRALTLMVSVLIVAVPEGLPMMITLVLSRSMFGMLKDNIMVRKLMGIETAGSINILFTDKTGTLTRGKLEVTELVTGDGRAQLPFSALKEGALGGVLAASCHLNSSATMAKSGQISGGNMTDRALLKMAADIAPPKDFIKIKSSPFDSKKKFSSALIEYGEEKKRFCLFKGAPELLLPKCHDYITKEGHIAPMRSYAKVESLYKKAGQKGQRVLCLCAAKEADIDYLPQSLIFLGLAIISDPLRVEAPSTIEKINRAGIQVVMITGDSRETAEQIAKEAGLILSHGDAVLLSSELASMTDHEVLEILPNLRVLARALPTDKSRLVAIAQKAGLVCAMTGDGINDAPALKLADVGFAMGSGTEVAKEAGDIIILDDNISSISKAILYGRTIFKSIQKFIVFQLSINFSAVIISVIGPFLGFDSPITVLQMLWINIIMDTLAGLAFAGEPPMEEYMKEPPKKRDAPVLTRQMARQIGFISIFNVVLCLLFLKSSLIGIAFSSSEAHMTGFFALFVFLGIAGSFCARAPEGGLFKGILKNKSFILIMGSVFLVQMAIIYFGGQMFRTFGLSHRQLIFVLSLAFCLILADILRKWLLKRPKKMYNSTVMQKGGD